MEECFRCGTTREETRLFDAIAEKGVVKACRECINRENLPTVKKPSLDQLKESDERLSVREKLSMMAGIETRRDSQGNREYVKTSAEKGKNEFDLNDIIERNLEKKKLSKKSMEKLPPEKELVENFHWKVMRGRRLKKISQEQLGKEIGESGTAIKMVESGELPEDFERLIKKLEAYLRIRIFKDPRKSKEKQKSEAEISFDPYTTKETTIEDLKKESSSDITKEREDSDESGESLEEDYEYPEQNKARRKKLWNLFRNKAKNVQNAGSRGEEIDDEKKDDTFESVEGNSDGFDYDGLEDYSYHGYGHPKEEEQKYKSHSNKNDKDKKDQDKKDQDELSQKDIDDLIFRKG